MQGQSVPESNLPWLYRGHSKTPGVSQFFICEKTCGGPTGCRLRRMMCSFFGTTCCLTKTPGKACCPRAGGWSMGKQSSWKRWTPIRFASVRRSLSGGSWKTLLGTTYSHIPSTYYRRGIRGITQKLHMRTSNGARRGPCC